MKTLLLYVPTAMPGPDAAYGVAWADATAPQEHLHSTPHTLATLAPLVQGAPLVLVLPAQAVSWQSATLPAGLGRSADRLRAVLVGLLEDQLLQDAAQVHLALPRHWQAGEPTWVAACDRAWLQAHVQALDAAGLATDRAVPELAPPTKDTARQADAPPDRCWALGDHGEGWLWQTSAAHGVWGWPVATSHPLAHPHPAVHEGDGPVWAEPGLATWAQAQWGERVTLVAQRSHWQDALAGPWDLLQLGVASTRRARHWLWLRRTSHAVWALPAYRAVRWGLAAYLLAQALGLSAWAWRTQHSWQDDQAQWGRTLQEAFPHVKVVLDAPAQMAREVARLQQRAGQLTATDMEAMLHALGQAWPTEAARPRSLSYQNNALQWPAAALTDAQRQALGQALRQSGYTLSSDAAHWQLRATEGTP